MTTRRSVCRARAVRGRRTIAAGRAALAALLAAVVLTGCASVGAHSPVEPGLEVRGADVQPPRALFPGPAKGATQEQIILGFVRAGAASDGDYSTARSFLTEDAARAWVPEGEVVLYSTSAPPKVTPLQADSVRITAVVDSTIGPDGRFVGARQGATRSADFGFSRINDEWRISSVPKGFGRWLTTSDLGRLLKPYDVHYLSREGRALVPDRLWFPRDHLATRLARAQLGAPPAYLADAVTTAIPAGARLIADSVTVTDGIAQVEITGSVPTDRTQRENVYVQLVSTLAQDPSVQGVRVRVGDTTLEIPDVDLPVRSLEQVGFVEPDLSSTGRAVVRRREAIFFLPTTFGSDEDPQPSGNVDVPHDFTSLALSANGEEIAAVDPDGKGISRFRGVTRYEVPFFGTDVGRPTYDRTGRLWLGGNGLDDDADISLWTVDVSGDPARERLATARPVSAEWLVGRRVIEAKPSAEADRVAVLHTAANGTDPRIDLAGVVRGQDGAPERLAPPLRLGASLTGVTDLVWLSDLSLAALAKRAGTSEKLRPYVISVDGQDQPLAETPDAVAITSIGGERDIIVTTSDQRVLSRAGGQWLSLGPGSDVAVPAH